MTQPKQLNHALEQLSEQGIWYTSLCLCRGSTVTSSRPFLLQLLMFLPFWEGLKVLRFYGRHVYLPLAQSLTESTHHRDPIHGQEADTGSISCSWWPVPRFNSPQSALGVACEFRSTGYLDLPRRLQRSYTSSANMIPPSFGLLLNQGDGGAPALVGDRSSVPSSPSIIQRP